jgi:hypothetical protein
MYLHLTPYKNDIIFLMRQTLVRDYYATNILYYFLCTLMISNIKTENSKVIDLIESYNFHVKIFLFDNIQKRYYFSNATSTSTWLLCSCNFILFFKYLNVLKWKNTKLESCRSHRVLQFSYKFHLHPISYQRVTIFQKFSLVRLRYSGYLKTQISQLLGLPTVHKLV